MSLLTPEQAAHWRQHGYVVLPGLVPRERVDDALRAINYSMGQGMPPEEMSKFRSQSYCPEITACPAIVDTVAAEPVWPVVASMLEPGKVEPPQRAQVALRFPAPPGTQAGKPFPHVDGFPAPNNGVREGTISSFQGLVGVMLSELPHSDAGNFTVWPGTHRIFAQYFAERTPEQILRESTEGILRVGVPPVELPEPVAIKANPGDVVVAHYLLAHGVTPNVSPHIRYALFFRLRHEDHASHAWDMMGDVNIGWRV